MGLTVVDTGEIRRLFTFIRDGSFSWTVADVPQLVTTLGWAITEEVPPDGAVAATRGGLPDDPAYLLYHEGTVRSVNIPVTASASDGPLERLAVIDAFATTVATATEVLGPPTRTFPGQVPRAQWLSPKGSVTITNLGNHVLVIWASSAYQAFNESVGRD